MDSNFLLNGAPTNVSFCEVIIDKFNDTSLGFDTLTSSIRISLNKSSVCKSLMGLLGCFWSI